MSDGTADSFYNKKEKSIAPIVTKIMQRNIGTVVFGTPFLRDRDEKKIQGYPDNSHG